MRGDWSNSLYWENWWPSLFKRSLNKGKQKHSYHSTRQPEEYNTSKCKQLRCKYRVIPLCCFNQRALWINWCKSWSLSVERIFEIFNLLSHPVTFYYRRIKVFPHLWWVGIFEIETYIVCCRLIFFFNFFFIVHGCNNFI